MQASMSNHTHIHDYKNDPRYQMFTNLVMQCYTKNISHSTFLEDNYDEEGKWCPRIFDGWSCWDETPASVTAYQACPHFIVGFDPRRIAYKRCTENGTWYINPNNNKPWTNYTTCVDIEDLDFRTIINSIYVIGYSVSVAALLLSLMIFLYFRSLQCTRIRIHMHLFTSFALNNILWIVWYRTVVNKASVVQENKEWCQLLHVITNYFMVTSYFWMFCEGLHLHIALVVIMLQK